MGVASGRVQVYKAIDQRNGSVVAVKEVPLDGRTEADLRIITSEINLLQSLRHGNIVRCMGSTKANGYLYIMLEYVENGSLAQIIRPTRFGAFPEALVKVYELTPASASRSCCAMSCCTGRA